MRRTGWLAVLFLARGAWRGASRVGQIAAECHRAQRRLTAIRLSPDRYVLADADQPPATYAEFLFRTSGGLLREPSADNRLASPDCRR